jgi:hypothetical protein
VLYQAVLVSGAGALLGLAAAGLAIGRLAPAPALLTAAGVAVLATVAASGPAARARALSARTLGDDG